VLVREGANDLNAMTNSDMTMYIASLPSNKFALWSYWESQRLIQRVFREFFAEKDVVAEERRMSVDNDPEGRLYEALLGAGFKASPYRVMTIGTPGDIRSYTPAQAKAFYEKYYIPSRMVVSVVGNFDLDAAETVIRKDFGSIPERDDPAVAFPTETFEGSSPRKAVVTAASEPRFILGYHRPAWPHSDDAVMDVLESILCEGESSRLVKNLIYRDQVIVGLDCSASFPGERLDSLFTMFVIPAPGRSNAEAAHAVRAEIRKLAEEGPTDLELRTARNNDEADLVYAMESNDGLADVLAYHQTLTGDWRDMYAMRDAFARVGADDVKRALKAYFTPAREVEADLEPRVMEGGR
jgi:predicted Zn-dependent peptidase